MFISILNTHSTVLLTSTYIMGLAYLGPWVWLEVEEVLPLGKRGILAMVATPALAVWESQANVVAWVLQNGHFGHWWQCWLWQGGNFRQKWQCGLQFWYLRKATDSSTVRKHQGNESDHEQETACEAMVDIDGGTRYIFIFMYVIRELLF